MIITIQSSPDKAEKEDEEVATLTREEAASGLAIGSATDSGVNLYILAGHEAMQLWGWWDPGLSQCKVMESFTWFLMS